MHKLSDIKPDVLASIKELLQQFDRDVLAEDMKRQDIASKSEDFKAGYMKGRREEAATTLKVRFQEAGLLPK